MKKLCFLILGLMFCLGAKAQDPYFSQPLSNPIYLNPAFAGYDGCPTIRTSYRNQESWRSGTFHTVNFSYDQMVGERHGLYLNYQYNNEAEVISTQELSFGYAPAFWVANKQVMLSPAIEIGWRNRTLHHSKLTENNIQNLLPYIDYYSIWPLPTEDRTRNFVDFSAGALITFKGLVYGIAVHHLSQPDQGFFVGMRLPLKINTHINYTFQVTEKFRIAPSMMYQHQQDYEYLISSLSFSAYGARAGLALRQAFNNPDALIFQFGYNIKGFMVGYSFDATVSSLTNNTVGSHEVSLGYIFNCKKKDLRKGVSQIAF